MLEAFSLWSTPRRPQSAAEGFYKGVVLASFLSAFVTGFANDPSYYSLKILTFILALGLIGAAMGIRNQGQPPVEENNNQFDLR
jgi:hypothetical protein